MFGTMGGDVFLHSLIRFFSEKPSGSNQSGAGIALRNVKMRLAALYGAEHPLTVESVPRKGTTVSFTIPFGGGGGEGSHH